MPASSMPTSQRTSVSSSASNEAKKSRWHRFLDELKPIDEPQTPVGTYTPVSPSEKKVKDEKSKVAKAYEHFKAIVGGPKVGST